ncbi:MAG: hypothetical protein IH898_08915 [Planctomycetes bacterium]|nr:hypothetical protein [Planctomycetota bacterium]
MGAKGLKKTLAIETASAGVHGGKHSLKITVNKDSHESGGLFTRLKKGRDQLFARMYIKFAFDYQYESHTGFMMTASTDKTPWFNGSAGIVPRGDDRFSGTLEPEPAGGEKPPGHWTLYSYWHEMKGRWGNNLGSKNQIHVPRDQWICIELMLKANSTPQKPG